MACVDGKILKNVKSPRSKGICPKIVGEVRDGYKAVLSWQKIKVASPKKPAGVKKKPAGAGARKKPASPKKTKRCARREVLETWSDATAYINELYSELKSATVEADGSIRTKDGTGNPCTFDALHHQAHVEALLNAFYINNMDGESLPDAKEHYKLFKMVLKFHKHMVHAIEKKYDNVQAFVDAYARQVKEFQKLLPLE